MILEEKFAAAAPAMQAAHGGDFHLQMRAATRDDHRAVDDAFHQFDLSRRDGYRRFLSAHARILPAAEHGLDPASLLSDWRPRAGALLDDLSALGLMPPPALGLAPFATEAARWGALYVLEGSRLGGLVLSRGVPAGLPRAYLGAHHPPGAWRSLLATLDGLASRHGASWEESAIGGAHALFSLFARAADAEAKMAHG